MKVTVWEETSADIWKFKNLFFYRQKCSFFRFFFNLKVEESYSVDSNKSHKKASYTGLDYLAFFMSQALDAEFIQNESNLKAKSSLNLNSRRFKGKKYWFWFQILSNFFFQI